MADLSGFDANQVEPTGDFEPIPAGKYLAVITDSEMKPTKSGTGSLLQLFHGEVLLPVDGGTLQRVGCRAAQARSRTRAAKRPWRSITKIDNAPCST